MTTASSGEFMNVHQMAAALGVSPTRVYRLVAEGKLPATRVAGVIRAPKVAWQRWHDQQVEVALADCSGAEVRSR